MITMRLWFTKTGEAAYISLLDLQRVMQRAFKRSGLPVWYTQGFNPHIYMTFSAPLALGQESLCESLDFKTEAESFDWAAGCGLLTSCLPGGIKAVKIEPAGMDPGCIAAACYTWTADAGAAENARLAAEAYNAADTVPVQKKSKHKKVKEIDLKQYLPALHWAQQPDGTAAAQVTLPAGSTLTVNPALVLSWLCEHSALQPWQIRILRTGLCTGEGKAFR